MYQNAVENNKIINSNINGFTVASLEQVALSKSIKDCFKTENQRTHIKSTHI